MQYQMKTVITDSLIKAVENSPTKKSSNPYEITKDEYNIWINYVYSILKIISQHVDDQYIESVIFDIDIVKNKEIKYCFKINEICQILLNFARKILYL